LLYSHQKETHDLINNLLHTSKDNSHIAVGFGLVVGLAILFIAKIIEFSVILNIGFHQNNKNIKKLQNSFINQSYNSNRNNAEDNNRRITKTKSKIILKTLNEVLNPCYSKEIEAN
jgi:hypothetical protein